LGGRCAIHPLHEQASHNRSEAMPIEVAAHITGTVWRIEKGVGEDVTPGEVLVILESMKMEMPVESPSAGKVRELRCKEAQPVSEGDILMILE
jgi:acetyl-CoA carboxylase biotin carboxyl carrier protein